MPEDAADGGWSLADGIVNLLSGDGTSFDVLPKSGFGGALMSGKYAYSAPAVVWVK
jgi:hypothetical protein